MFRTIALALILLAPSMAMADSFAEDSFFADVATGPGGAATGDIDLGVGGYRLLLDDGTVGAPSLTFTTDPDTGMHLVAGNVLGFGTGGAFRLALSSAGSNFFGGNLIDYDDMRPNVAMSTDADPTPITVIGTKHPWPGVGGTFTDGAPLCVIPASGANNLTGVTAGNTAGLTFTFTSLDMNCEETITVITEGIDFACVAETDADCVVNIAAEVNGLAAALGLNAATVVGETTNFFPTVGTIAHLTVVSSDNAEMVIVRGTDGQLILTNGASGAPSIAHPAGLTTGFYWPSANQFGITASGTPSVIFSASSANFFATSLTDTTRALALGGNCDAAGSTGEVCSAGDHTFDGDILMGAALTTDADPSNPAILGPNSWARATGSNRIGGTVHVGGGIGTRQIICTDRTVADTDEVRFEINDQVTTLVESTDFDCEGEASEEVCCDNVGSAIITAAIGITPDCDTTAGTCYLTPDADLYGLDIFLIDGGVNGIFATKVQGSQGQFHAMGSSITLADQMFDLADNTAMTFVKIEVDSNTHFGAQLFYSIHADDGTDYQLISGMITIAAVNKAGTITCSIGTPPGNFEAVALSGSTLTLDIACVDAGSGVIDLTADADTGLTPTTLEFHYSVLLNDPAVVIPQ